MHNGRTVLRLQYQLASLPLRLLERQTRFLGTDSSLHLLAERVMARLDAGAGQLLDDDELRRRGRREGRHADSLSRATDLENQARRRRVEAQEQAQQASQSADERRRQAREDQQERLSGTVEQKKADEQKIDQKTREEAEDARQSADAKARTRMQGARSVQRQKDEQAKERTRRATEK